MLWNAFWNSSVHKVLHMTVYFSAEQDQWMYEPLNVPDDHLSVQRRVLFGKVQFYVHSWRNNTMWSCNFSLFCFQEMNLYIVYCWDTQLFSSCINLQGVFLTLTLLASFFDSYLTAPVIETFVSNCLGISDVLLHLYEVPSFTTRTVFNVFQQGCHGFTISHWGCVTHKPLTMSRRLPLLFAASLLTDIYSFLHPGRTSSITDWATSMLPADAMIMVPHLARNTPDCISLPV